MNESNRLKRKRNSKNENKEHSTHTEGASETRIVKDKEIRS